MSPRDAHDTLLAEDELREALAPFAPDDDASVAAVRRRITARGGDPDADTADEERELHSAAWDSPFVRRAAAFLPLGILTRGAVPTAKAAGPKFGWQSIGLLLTIPAVSVVLLVTTFLGAVRALPRARGEDAMEEWAMREEVNLWIWGHWWQLLVTWTGLGLLFATQPALAFTGGMLLSMAALVLILRHLSTFGLVSAAFVGRATGSFLGMVYLWSGFAYRPVHEGWGGSLQQSWVAMVFCLGAVACFWVARTWVPRTYYQRIGFGSLVLMAVGLLWSMLEQHRLSWARCVQYAERYGEEADQRADWENWSRLVRSLRQTMEGHGGELDLSGPEQRLAEYRDQGASEQA